jgi:hypothetical protein
MANDKKPPFQSTTVEKTKPLVDDKLKPTAEVHFLVGGPYTKKNGEAAPYGHTALRLKTKAYDLVYDFGRYGNVSTAGKILSRVYAGTIGDGILRVWSNAAEYISEENTTLRKTTGVAYQIFDHQADKAKAHFDRVIKAAEALSGKSDEYMTVYKTKAFYHALGPNCTTVSIEGAQYSVPKIMDGQEKYWKPEDVLDGAMLVGVKAIADKSFLFLPENLRKFLLEGCKFKKLSVTVHQTVKAAKPT